MGDMYFRSTEMRDPPVMLVCHQLRDENGHTSTPAGPFPSMSRVVQTWQGSHVRSRE
jgi:hypothetical protein